MEVQEAFTDIGDSVSRVEHILKEQGQLEERGQVNHWHLKHSLLLVNNHNWDQQHRH